MAVLYPGGQVPQDEPTEERGKVNRSPEAGRLIMVRIFVYKDHARLKKLPCQSIIRRHSLVSYHI
jgi:hypothetical protein